MEEGDTRKGLIVNKGAWKKKEKEEKLRCREKEEYSSYKKECFT